MTNKIRLAVLMSHPIQYFVPVYQHLAKDKRVELKVFYVGENGVSGYFDEQFNKMVEWDLPLTEGYCFEFLQPGHTLPNFSFNTVDAPTVLERMRSFEPDYVWISGYAYKVVWRVLFGLRKRTKFIYSSDSNLADHRGFLRRAIKHWVVRLFFKKIYAFISCSPANMRYLRFYRATDWRIVNSVLPADTQRLQRQAESVERNQVDELRMRLGIGLKHPVILFAGKLIEHKRPQDVISLLVGLRELGHRNVHAVIIGSGVMDAELKAMTAFHGLNNNVHFIGFVNQSALASYFSLSDFLLFPSSKEPYGVIATEVLPFGLPILASSDIGAVGATILDDKNALLFPCGDTKKMVSQAARLISDPSLRHKMSEKSRQLAPQHDASVLAHDLIRICVEPLPIKTNRDKAMANEERNA